MEDWKKRWEDFMFAEDMVVGGDTVLNPKPETYEDFVNMLDDIEDFIEQELSKAREEGRFTQWELEYIRELAKEDRLFTRNVVEYNTDTRLIKKISELLKDNK